MQDGYLIVMLCSPPAALPSLPTVRPNGAEESTCLSEPTRYITAPARLVSAPPSIPAAINLSLHPSLFEYLIWLRASHFAALPPAPERTAQTHRWKLQRRWDAPVRTHTGSKSITRPAVALRNLIYHIDTPFWCPVPKVANMVCVNE